MILKNFSQIDSIKFWIKTKYIFIPSLKRVWYIAPVIYFKKENTWYQYNFQLNNATWTYYLEWAKSEKEIKEKIKKALRLSGFKQKKQLF